MAEHRPRSAPKGLMEYSSPATCTLLPKPPATPPASPASRSSPASRRIIQQDKPTDSHREACDFSRDNPDWRTPSPGDPRYTPDKMSIQIPDDTDTSDEEIHRLTCRKSRRHKNNDSSGQTSPAPSSSSDDLSPEDAIKLSELESVREDAHREVEMYLLRAQTVSRSSGLSPNPSQSGDEMWSSIISLESNAEKKSGETATLAEGCMQNAGFGLCSASPSANYPEGCTKEPVGQNEDYFHRVVPVSLPLRDLSSMKHGRRYRRYKNKTNATSNRLSESLRRYAQYQNIWADIYEEQDIGDISGMAEFDPNGPHGYIAPLVCPLPGEESEEEDNEESCSSQVPVNPIIQAVLNQDAATLEKCLESDSCDINTPIDEGGWTALHFAVRFSNTELCRMLLSHGADIESCDTVEHWTPLHVAAMTSDITPETLKLLLDHVQDVCKGVHKTDVQGRTALHLCFLSACKKLAEKELNTLMDQRIMDDFHYFILRAGDWSIWNTTVKKPKGDDCDLEQLDDVGEMNGDMTPFPVSDSQHTLTDALQNVANETNDTDSLHQNDMNTCSGVLAQDNASPESSDSDTREKDLSYDPDQSSEAVDSDNKQANASRKAPLELMDDTESAEEPPGQISFPLCTIPEERVVDMTARYVTTTLTFQQNNHTEYDHCGRERFEYQSDDSSVEECVAVLETFYLSSDDERAATRQQTDQTQMTVIREKVRLLLASGLLLSARDNRGDCVLHYAAWIDNLDIFKDVIERNVDLCKATNYEGQTILHMAALSGYPDIIKLLLEKGADPNVLDQHRSSPADLFIMEHFRKRDSMITPWLRSKEMQPRHSLDVCLELLQLFSDKGCVVSNIAILDHLLNNIPLDKLEEMVEAKPKFFDFLATNFQQQTLLHVASLRRYSEDQMGMVSLLVGFLVKSGVPVDGRDINGRTALHLACWQRNKAIVKTLLAHCASTEICDKFSQSCLHYAVTEVTHTLPNWSSFSAFQAALACLADPAHPQKLVEYQLDILELLLAHGASLQQTDCHGRTVLHKAITDSDKAIVAYLVSRGADLNAPDANGLSPTVYIVKLHRNELFHLTFSTEKNAKSGFGKCKDLPPFKRPIIAAIEEQPGNTNYDPLEQVRRMRGNVDKFTKKLLTMPGIGHVVFEGENANIRAEIFLLMQRLASRLGQIDPRLASSVHIVGSVREDTKVGQANGFDYIFELVNLKNAFQIDEGAADMVRHSSYVSLKLKRDANQDAKLSSFCDSRGVLRGSVLASVFGSAVLRVVSQSDVWSDLKFMWEDDMELGSNFVTFPCMLQLRWMGPKYRDLLITVDIVPAIFVPDRVSSTVAKPAKSSGNTVLIKWQGDLLHDSKLQLSFFDIENQVFQTIPSIIKDGYRLAKVVSTTGLCQQEGSGVDVFLLKTVLLWLLYPEGDINGDLDLSWLCPIGNRLSMSQSIQKWTEVRWVAFHLFDRLESHLYTEYLASFFVPAENILPYTSSNLDQMIDLCIAAKALLSDPD